MSLRNTHGIFNGEGPVNAQNGFRQVRGIKIAFNPVLGLI